MRRAQAAIAPRRRGKGTVRAPLRRAARMRAARFGRGRRWQLEAAVPQTGWAISDDLRLFASTFAAGFLFVAILIA